MRISMSEAMKNAARVFFREFPIILVISLIVGGIGAIIVDQVTGLVFAYIEGNFDKGEPIRQGQMMLVTATLLSYVALSFWGGIVGAWAAPATIYLWVQEYNQRPASLSGAINFGIDRYKQVLGAHFKAYALIIMGQVILLPTIVFGLQYAFVDAIATLNKDEPRPLFRSGRLTLGRRGQIFRTFLLGTVWWIPWQLFGTFYAQDAGLWVMFAGGVVDYALIAFFDLVLVQYYLSLYAKADDAATDKTASPAL